MNAELVFVLVAEGIAVAGLVARDVLRWRWRLADAKARAKETKLAFDIAFAEIQSIREMLARTRTTLEAEGLLRRSAQTHVDSLEQRIAVLEGKSTGTPPRHPGAPLPLMPTRIRTK